MKILTWYLSRLFIARFVLLLFGMGAFLIGLDLIANARSVMTQDDGGTAALARYIMLRSPTIVSDLIKIATLLAGLLTLTLLIRHGELTAIWNSGVSQFGLVGRLIPLAIALGGLQFVVDNEIVPPSVQALQDWGVADNDRRPGLQDGHGMTWIHLGNDIVRVPSENIEATGLRDFTLFERNADGRLLARVDVQRAEYRDGLWRLTGVTTISAAGGQVTFEAVRDWPIDLQATSLKHLLAHPRDLSFYETQRFVGGEGRGTWAPYLYETWHYAKLADCLVPFLMLCLSVFLAHQSQRSGRLGFLLLGGITLGFVFFIFNGITLAMGEVGLLPPLLASIAPLVSFAAVAASVAYWHELKHRPT
ncbi:LptF/LptG family permease [Pelagibius sp.]|uniref:LptF/LptG family permease n=1 Tax=Pelagibius sp. TaxID=1931238 RepID=UPI003B5129A9